MLQCGTHATRPQFLVQVVAKGDNLEQKKQEKKREETGEKMKEHENARKTKTQENRRKKEREKGENEKVGGEKCKQKKKTANRRKNKVFFLSEVLPWHG